jgi:hypothetical protein
MNKRILLMLSIIFALLVNVASAETIVLNQMNDDSIPDGFEVTVTTDSNLNTMHVEVTSCPSDWTVQGIDTVYYNLGRDSYAVTHVDGNPISSLSSTWAQSSSTNNVAGFGIFLSGSVKNTAPTQSQLTSFTFKLSDIEGTIPVNYEGHKVAVHMRLLDGSDVVVEDDSTWITDDSTGIIPEFPSIALPIAAILGLMFILQSRRRKED